MAERRGAMARSFTAGMRACKRHPAPRHPQLAQVEQVNPHLLPPSLLHCRVAIVSGRERVDTSLCHLCQGWQFKGQMGHRRGRCRSKFAAVQPLFAVGNL